MKWPENANKKQPSVELHQICSICDKMYLSMKEGISIQQSDVIVAMNFKLEKGDRKFSIWILSCEMIT
jgi:hypothetical protein